MKREHNRGHPCLARTILMVTDDIYLAGFGSTKNLDIYRLWLKLLRHEA